MKKLNTSVALAALAAVMVTPALAADPVVPMPEAANWTAFHVGVGGGGAYGFADDSTNTGFIDFNAGVSGFGESFSDLGKAGGFGTVEAGFDYQMDSIVVGLLANYDFGKTKMRNDFDGLIVNINGPIDGASLESKWEIGDSWAVGGRLGFLVTDSTLVYALGGYTQAKIESEASFSANNVPFGFSFSDSKWEDGWFAGGGIEALLSDNISLKGEYRYADFGKVDRSENFSDVNVNAVAGTSQNADITVHSVRAVLSYRFGLAAGMETAALAADPEVPMPEAANWTAFHVGVGGGGTYGFADDSTNTGFIDFNAFVTGFGDSFSDLGKAGGFGTVEAGFDYQMDRLVAGVLANYDFGKTRMTNDFNGLIFGIPGPIDGASLESKWEIGDSWAAGGRLGFLVADSTLVYALGGYIQAKIESEASFSADNVPFGFSFSDSKWEDGWFAGGGIEALLSDNISLKGEYRYADFGKVDRSEEFSNVNFLAGTSQNADITVHSVRAVLSYRFGL